MLGLVYAADSFRLPGGGLRERAGIHTAGQFERFVENHGERPFFAWVHLFDAHAPYEMPHQALARAPRGGPPLRLPKYWPRPYRSVTSIEWLIDSYKHEISRVDKAVGRVIDALESKGITENTVVVVVSDHGESLTEHDTFFDHGQHLYDPSLRVPLIVVAPGVSQAGLRVSCQLSTQDVAPSLLELGGLEPADSQVEHAQSFVAQLAGGDCESREVFSTTVGSRFVRDPPVDHSTRMPDSKMILRGSGLVEQYDLLEDPREMNNLARANPALMAEIRAQLEERLGEAAEPVEMAPDPANIEAMRALGYVE